MSVAFNVQLTNPIIEVFIGYPLCLIVITLRLGKEQDKTRKAKAHLIALPLVSTRRFFLKSCFQKNYHPFQKDLGLRQTISCGM